MPRNIEIKARLGSGPALDDVEARAVALATNGPHEIIQDDTFFRCDSGRLKLRAFAGGHGELIYYRRADAAGPKESFYTIAPVEDPDALRRALTLALGTIGRVRKRRTLYLVGRTRVHLDRVEGLGEFLELEVVLRDDETAEVGEAEAHVLMGELGIVPAQLIEGAYLDLLGAARD
ncbi:MAG: class IV adenylate cyclase [bacterium]|nr:class IV adenylate cyclase [bacterium]